jgi:tetratricopeptide (TPR) repeat protein
LNQQPEEFRDPSIDHGSRLDPAREQMQASPVEMTAETPAGARWRIQHFSEEFRKAYAAKDFEGALTAASSAHGALAHTNDLTPVQRLSVLNNYAQACLATSKAEQAEGALLTALKIRDRAPEVRELRHASLAHLAKVYQELGQDDLAEKMLIGAVKADAADIRSVAPEALLKAPVSQLWQYYRGKENFLRAVEVLKESMEIYGEVWRANPARLGLMMGELGSLQLYAGDPESALLSLTAGVQTTEKKLGRKHASMVTLNTLMACTLALLDRPAEAAPYVRKARDLEGDVPQKESRVYEIVRSLARGYSGRGDRIGFDRLVAVAAEGFRTLPPPPPPGLNPNWTPATAEDAQVQKPGVFGRLLAWFKGWFS